MHSAPAATSRSSASRTDASSSGSRTSPAGPIRSFTPTRIARGARNTGVWGSSRTSYISRRIWRPISRVSRNPSVVMIPSRPPFRSSTALVATVVPCASCVRAPGSTPSAARRSTAASAASPGFAGVLGTLNTRGGRPSRTHTTSVNVPPTSTPIRDPARDSVMTSRSQENLSNRSGEPRRLFRRPFRASRAARAARSDRRSYAAPGAARAARSDRRSCAAPGAARAASEIGTDCAVPGMVAKSGSGSSSRAIASRGWGAGSPPGHPARVEGEPAPWDVRRASNLGSLRGMSEAR